MIVPFFQADDVNISHECIHITAAETRGSYISRLYGDFMVSIAIR